MIDNPQNVYAVAARSKKVAALVDYWRNHGFSASEARDMPYEDWTIAARCANVKPPSAITCAAVVAQMEAIEAEQREETRRLDAEQNEDGGTRCPPLE